MRACIYNVRVNYLFFIEYFSNFMKTYVSLHAVNVYDNIHI